MTSSARTKLRKEARANLDRAIERMESGNRHYLIRFPIVASEWREIEVYTNRGIVLKSSSEYLYRMFGKPFRAWLNFAFDMYQQELKIVEVDRRGQVINIRPD